MKDIQHIIGGKMTKLKKTKKEWQCELSPKEFQVTREGGTESPYTNKFYKHTERGIYKCVCCDVDLFISNDKYHSGSGWPSYNQPINNSVLNEVEDVSLGMVRSEVKCTNCDAHLGHVFPDNSQKTGKRY
jgi:peptide-methionine (R)-S-oxide reductase